MPQQICNTSYHFLQLQFLKLPFALLMTSHASLDTHNIKSAIVDELFQIVKKRNLTFVLFVVVSHIIGDKFYDRFCLFVVILNGLGIRVCYG